MNKKPSHLGVEEEEAKKDPYLLLGYGMIAYRDLMLAMIYLFTFFTILTIPATIFFSAHAGYGSNPNTSWASLSLGSYGYSATDCEFVPMPINSLSF